MNFALQPFFLDRAHLRETCRVTERRKFSFNPFSTNVPVMDKPGSCFLLPKCLKNTSGIVTF